VADFASRTASGALTAAVSAEVERLRTQHADAVREKSASDSKCRKLTDKVAALEREKADLRRQLAAERREANEAIAKEQAAQAEGNLAKELSEHLQERLTALESRAKGAEAAMRAEAERTRTQLMDTYRELGARTGDFEVPEREPGLRCLQWVQEELQELPAVVGGVMSYASLVTCEGAMNALSREGCRHFEVFDQADEDFGRDVYKVVIVA
jgi:chromosome segregation ATPase